MISLPSVIDDAKVELYRALKASGLRKAELARRMGIHKQQVERLMDIDHASRIEQLEAAFAALNMRLVLDIRHEHPARRLTAARSVARRSAGQRKSRPTPER